MRKGRKVLRRIPVFILMAFALQLFIKQMPRFIPLIQSAAFYSAGNLMPEGTLNYLLGGSQPDDINDSFTNAPLNISNNQVYISQNKDKDPLDLVAGGQPFDLPENQTDPNSLFGQVKEEDLSGKDGGVLGVHITNLTQNHKDIDIAAALATRPDINIYKNKKPQVLIVHTHTTECYANSYTGTFLKTAATRSRDKDRNVIRIGKEIAAQLKAADIAVIHDTTIHDDPSYSGAYDMAAKTVTNILKKYPSIDVVIDVHRDSITRNENLKIKPTTVIDGKKCAQVMLLMGCDDKGNMKHPDWMRNFCFAVLFQQKLEQMYPGLARPIYFKNGRFNQHLSKGSILLEVGSDVNTLDEAIYAGKLAGKALVATLESLKA